MFRRMYFGHPIAPYPVLRASNSDLPGAGAGHDDEIDDLELPPVTADQAANSQIQQYHHRVSRHIQRINRREARYRNELRDAQAALAQQTSRLAPEGAVILTGDDAKAWEVFKGLGKPEEVVAKLSERDTLATKVAGIEKDAKIGEVAQAAGYKVSVLKQLGGDREYELRDVTGTDGATLKVPFVKDGEAMKPLAEYASAAWADFLPALQAGQTGQGGGNTPANTTHFPPQVPSGGGSNRPLSPLAAFQQEQANAEKAAQERVSKLLAS